MKDSFSEMTWQEFEDYVIEILNTIYEKNNPIEIKKTDYRNDGGKDGYVILHINSNIDPEVDNSLSYNVVFWVEVKKRSSTNVSESDIGGNVLLALNNNVNKLIFVSNRDFTSRTKEVCISVAKRLNTSISFINGKKLITFANAINKQSIANSLLQEKNLSKINSYVSIITGFVSDPEYTPNDSLLSVDIEEVIFWICEISGTISKGICPIKICTNNIESSGLFCKCLSKDSIYLDSTETIQRVIFGVYATKPGKYKCKDILKELKTEKDIIVKYLSSGSILNVKESILCNTLSASRENIVNNIVGDFKILLKEKKIRGCLLEAVAGTGKTFLINKIRQKIIHIGGQEIYLDGALHRGVSDIVKSLIAKLFPLPLDLLSSIDLIALKKWIFPNNYNENKQDKIFLTLMEALKGNFENLFDVQNIALALALMLIKSSLNKPIILIFEDLHKINTSVLQFIRNIIVHIISRKEGIIFFLFSSRPYSEDIGSNQIEWLQALNELCGEANYFSHYNIKSLAPKEAKDLIMQSLRGINDFEVNAIVEQVGTNPYNLKEALLYLEAEGAIEKNPIIGSYILYSNKIIDIIKSQTLHYATRNRLNILLSKENDYLRRFLISAACLGKFFSIKSARLSCPSIDDKKMASFISICEKHSILRFTNLIYTNSDIDCGFDHDLMRNTVLKIAGTFELQQISATLIDNCSFIGSSRLLLHLSYLAGNAVLCSNTINHLIEKSNEIKSNQDTLNYSLINLAMILKSSKLVDKSDFLKKYILKIDESFEFVDIPKMNNIAHLNTEYILEALLTPLKIMGEIGTFEKELSERLITLGGIRAEAFHKSSFKSSFKYYEGRLLSGQSKHIEALEKYTLAEESWPLGKDAKDKFLSIVRLRKSFCERHLGNIEKSILEMHRAIRLRSEADWNLLSQISANLGAFYMYDNQDIAERHWKRGLRIAQKTENYDEMAHFFNDLGHLDIMLDKYDDAREKIIKAITIAEDYGLLKEIIRSNIFLGCLDIINNNMELALFFMKDAENIAFMQNNSRRLWRIHANLATIAELDGRIDDAYIEDKKSLLLMPLYHVDSANKRQIRESGALVNIIERYSIAPQLYEDIKRTIPKNTWEYVMGLQKRLSKTNKDNLIKGIQSLYKKINGTYLWRFIITE